MPTTPTAIQIFNDENHNKKEIQNSSVEKVATDFSGGALYEGREWANTDDTRKRIYLGGSVRTYAFLSDVTGGASIQSGIVFSAGTYATPDDAGISGTINNGYMWFITGAPGTGTTLTDIGPSDTDIVNNGDMIIFTGANGTDASLLADWSDFQSIERNTNQVVTVVDPGVALTPDTDESTTMTGISVIGSYDILDTSTGMSVKQGVVSYVISDNVIKINSGIAMTVDIIATGRM